MKRAETNYPALVGSVNHAFLGPLNSILNVADLLLAGAGRESDTQFKRDVEEIVRDAERLNVLWTRLQGLLDLDVPGLSLSDVDLSDSIPAAIEDRRAAAWEGGITLFWHAIGQARPVQANGQAVVALVGKLLDHCLAIRAPSVISIIAAFEEAKRVVSVLEGRPEDIGYFSQPAPLPARRIRDGHGIDLLTCYWLARLIGASLWTSRKADTDQYAFHIALALNKFE